MNIKIFKTFILLVVTSSVIADYRTEPQPSFYEQDLTGMRVWGEYSNQLLRQLLLTDEGKLVDGYIESTKENEISAINVMVDAWNKLKTDDQSLSNYFLDELLRIRDGGCLKTYVEIYISRDWWESTTIESCSKLSAESIDESLAFPNHIRIKGV